MSAQKKVSEREDESAEAPAHRVRLPGFLIEKDVGLGDLIKKTSYAMRIKACAGCERRAAALNRWMTFTR